jgi:hypothetical protein
MYQQCEQQSCIAGLLPANARRFDVQQHFAMARCVYGCVLLFQLVVRCDLQRRIGERRRECRLF